MRAFEAGIKDPDKFWRLTPKELSLCLEAHDRAKRRQGEQLLTAAWLVAKLQRGKRIPSLKRLLGKDEARVLSPEEAEKVKAKHSELIERLAPDAEPASDDALVAFADRLEKEFAERIRGERTSPDTIQSD